MVLSKVRLDCNRNFSLSVLLNVRMITRTVLLPPTLGLSEALEAIFLRPPAWLTTSHHVYACVLGAVALDELIILRWFGYCCGSIWKFTKVIGTTNCGFGGVELNVWLFGKWVS